MKFFTQKWYQTMQQAGLAFPESDEEWQDFIQSFEEEGEDVYEYLRNDLEQMKGELLIMLPEKFHPYIFNKTINQPTLPKNIRDDLIKWMRDREKEVEETVDTYHKYFQHIQSQLPEPLIEINNAGLHDAQIKFIDRNDDQLRITLTGGGFSQGDVITIEISGIMKENPLNVLQTDMYWLYEEVDFDNQGYRLSVLFDSPMVEWNIIAQTYTITSYYKSESAFGWKKQEIENQGLASNEILQKERNLGITLPDSYKDLLQKQNGGELNHPIFLLKNKVIRIEYLVQLDHLTEADGVIPFAICADGRLAFNKNNQKIFYESSDGNKLIIAESFDSFIKNLLSPEAFDDPENEFVPIPEDELEEALFSGQLERIVRAWNTIELEPSNHVDLIKKAIQFYEEQEDDELQYISEIYKNHFSSILNLKD